MSEGRAAAPSGGVSERRAAAPSVAEPGPGRSGQQAAAHCENKPPGLDADDMRAQAGHFLQRAPPPPRGLHCHPGTASQRPDACSQKPSSSPGVDLKGPRISCSPTGLNICLQLTKKAGGAREAAEKGGRASGCQVCTHLSVNLEDNSRAGQVGRRE